ncbi:MAG: DUF1572 domain-containing protein [Flaviramulus sp.]|nr:DUF1572 domain-containing protein [Flaviramulus sp.]
MESFIRSVLKQFEYYKILGDKTFEQLSFDEMQWQSDSESNSISIIVKHLAGNMLSRWTNFLIEDGEKDWRNRDIEFLNNFNSKEEIIATWESGWHCFFKAIKPLNQNDLESIIYIRNEGHTILEAINRQLAHYPYHVGQIVFIGKLIKGKNWHSLSIPVGDSLKHNQEKFSKEKIKRHFTNDL